MSEILALLRSQSIAEAEHQLRTGDEYIAADRFAGIADATEVVDLYIGIPSDADISALIGVTFGTGGLAHLDTTNDASVDTSGTPLDYQSKGESGTMTTTVEAGGTYTTTGTALTTIQPGTQRDGGPISSSGGRAPTDVRLLQSGDGVEYVLTNQSGSATDFDVLVTVIELER